MINGIEDGCSNYARGHFTIGKKILKQTVSTLHNLVESCDCLQGFFLIHSQCGGTGAGFTSLVMEQLSIDFAKQSRFQMTVFPSEIFSTSVVEPFNCVLGIKDNITNSDVTNVFNNEALFKISVDLLDISNPTFSNINRILSQIISDITVSLRFESTLNSDLSQMGTNLIPYPKIHFITVSHSPLSSKAKSEHEKLNVNLLTRDLFRSSNQLITSDLNHSIYISCVLQYRGQVSPKEVSLILEKMKKRKLFKFVDWCPTGFKLGINCQPPVSISGSGMYQGNKSATMLINSSTVKKPLQVIRNKFDILFSKRSFIHWYVGEGMEEGEFNEAADEMYGIVCDYDEITDIIEDEDLLNDIPNEKDVIPEHDHNIGNYRSMDSENIQNLKKPSSNDKYLTGYSSVS